MKILVFEFISGGGLVGSPLPATLAAEGRLMLQTLLDELKSLPDLQLVLPLDQRCIGLNLPSNIEVVDVCESDDPFAVLETLIDRCDAVWPIAPETDGALYKIAKMVESRQKTLLLSNTETVAICSDKLKTYQTLKRNHLPAVETCSLADFRWQSDGEYVVKPIDGVGCEGNAILKSSQVCQRTMAGISSCEHYVIQPLMDGQPVSLSCLFKQGKGWLICCNRQHIEISDQRFRLTGCQVGAENSLYRFYQELVDKLAKAMPDLWGYIGVDIIETQTQGPLILDINPRLTTSYAGVRLATGINVAQQILQMLSGDPDVKTTNHRAVEIVIH